MILFSIKAWFLEKLKSIFIGKFNCDIGFKVLRVLLIEKFLLLKYIIY
ncbi:hypothetical protein L8106_11592 [Lyngbya sp. PCC 8106]|nr:hypothetical protein L8106_11592 [Lyngbya sp. PCC 8106]